MSAIRNRWGARIIWACAGTAIPAAVIAALVANESGGKPSASNLERGILSKFHNILNGSASGWTPLTARQLRALTDSQIVDYATSWGLTQITGYHMYPRDPRELLDPDTALRETVVLLEDWSKRYKLDPATQAEELFHCWNGGGPRNHTVPFYVDHALAHLRTYESLSGEGISASAGQAATRLPETAPAMHATREPEKNAGLPAPAPGSALLGESKEEKA